MKPIIKKALMLILLSALLSPQNHRAQTTGLPEDVEKIVLERVEFGSYVGVVIGMIDAEGPRYCGFGRMSLKSDQIPDENSVLEIGSITKVFTSILLADMVEHNKLRLEDPIEKFLPESVRVPKRNDQSITLFHLATHTSGLPHMPDNFNPADPSNPYADYSVEQMVEFLSNHTLRRDIGERYEYSNYATGLLGHILSRVGGITYEDLLIKKIADVLDLADTRITLTPEMKNRLAKGHSSGVEVANWDLSTLAGAGAIRSTTRDMVRFLSANMGLTESSLYSAMKKTHEPRLETGSSKMHVGLGWHIRTGDASQIVWHNGGTGGYRSFAGFDPKEKKGVVILANTTTSVDDIGFHLLDPTVPLQKLRRSIAVTLRQIIEEKGVEAAVTQYHTLKQNQPSEYDFTEPELNTLGYQYLEQGHAETAIALFKLNAEAYPDAYNVYDSLGEAYMKQGDTALAIANYKKSLALNPGNENAKQQLSKLGTDMTALLPEVSVPLEVLKSYVGKYTLAPGFFIIISTEDNRLMAQATGQPKFEIFPRSETTFYYKVVDAQITFNKNETGTVTGLTLRQGGREIPAVKTE